MDPFSAIAVLASLSILIKASDSALEILKSFREGEKDLLDLWNDIAIFEEALKGFDRVLRSRQTKHNISSHVIQNALDEGSATMAELELRLVESTKCNSSTVRRMRWVYHKSDFEKIHSRIKAQNTVLQSFLALAHASVSLPQIQREATRTYSRETFFAVCSQHPQFLGFSHGDNGRDDDGVSTQESIASDSSSLECSSSFTSLRRYSADTAPSSIGSATSSLGRVSIDSSFNSPPANIADVEQHGEIARLTSSGYGPFSAPIVRRACRYDCYCSCHSKNNTTSSRTLAKLSELKHQCTEPTCQGAILVRCRTEESSLSFRKALSHVLSSKSIKIRYDLNTFRMVSEGSDAMRYVKHGNLEKLKACIDTGEATLWDTAPDGWSLLHVSSTYP